MDPRNRFDDDDGDGAWRERLSRWEAPNAPARLEQALRGEFRRRRRVAAGQVWAGRAAVAALVLSAAVMARLGAPPRMGAGRGVGRSVAVATLDLSGFEPVERMRFSREARTHDDGLAGFEPVRKMTLTRWDGGRP